MKRFHQLPKRLWMSLIELLIVITVIWILIAVLVPQIGNTQAKSRDITRQTQVQELVAALMSYKLDYWEFPVILWSFQSWWISTETPYRWNISDRRWWSTHSVSAARCSRGIRKSVWRALSYFLSQGNPPQCG